MGKLGQSIDLHEASLRYQKRLIFENLSLSFKVGEWNAILGRSGVGKTSLLRLLAGLGQSQPDTEVSGEVLPAIAGNVAYMAQQDALLPWLSVLDNALIAFKLQGACSAHDRQAAAELFARVGLGGYLEHYPAQLSGGMRQRVALVRTLLQGKDVVLMDEPFSALDAITRLEIQDLSRTLLAGKTVILVTHDPLEALRLCSHIQVLGGEKQALLLEKITLQAMLGARDVSAPELVQHYAHILALLKG